MSANGIWCQICERSLHQISGKHTFDSLCAEVDENFCWNLAVIWAKLCILIIRNLRISFSWRRCLFLFEHLRSPWFQRKHWQKKLCLNCLQNFGTRSKLRTQMVLKRFCNLLKSIEDSNLQNSYYQSTNRETNGKKTQLIRSIFSNACFKMKWNRLYDLSGSLFDILVIIFLNRCVFSSIRNTTRITIQSQQKIKTFTYKIKSSQNKNKKKFKKQKVELYAERVESPIETKFIKREKKRF